MSARLFVIPGSHPSMAARLMLERKGIPYKRTDLVPVVSKAVVRAAGFPGVTVPALKIDGRRVQGSIEIARELDRIRPEPPLLPTDPAERAQVEEAERWGDQELQPRLRRIAWNGLKRDRAPLRGYSEGARLGVPAGLAARTSAPVVALAARFNHADDAAVRADLAALPAALDRIDGWIAEGVIGGEQPNAADYQIAPSVRLMMSMADLRPAVAKRPAGEMAMRLVPEFPGHMTPIFPADWLAPIRDAVPAQA